MSADTLVAVIGVLMALMIVGANGGLRRLPARRMLALAAVWGVVIVIVALAFTVIHPRPI